MNLVRYLLVGGCAAAVDFGLFAAAVTQFGVHWFPAAAASFLLATAVNYLLSIALVFESGVRFSKKNEWMIVLVVSAFGLVMNQAILWAAIESGRMPVLAAKLVATGCVFLWNYSVRRYFVFAPRM